MVGDNAEDVVQDLIEYLLKKRFPSPPHPERVLFWYVKNRAIQHLRSEKVKRKFTEKTRKESSQLQDFGIYPDRHQPEEDQSGKNIDILLDQFAKVDPVAREIFILRHVEGYTLVEIGKQTGISERRMKHIYTRVKKIIHDSAKKDGFKD